MRFEVILEFLECPGVGLPNWKEGTCGCCWTGGGAGCPKLKTPLGVKLFVGSKTNSGTSALSLLVLAFLTWLIVGAGFGGGA